MSAGASPCCPRCGRQIEDDEPAWLETATGELHPSSRWNLDADARRAAARIWHVGCFAEEYLATDGEV